MIESYADKNKQKNDDFSVDDLDDFGNPITDEVGGLDDFDGFGDSFGTHVRMLSPDKESLDFEDTSHDYALRPKRLVDYIGQESVTDNLQVFIEAAKLRGEPLDHVLFYGPPGLGKTTLAGIIAQELGVEIRITSGPAIERAGDLASILTNLSEGDVLFIDEIHRLNRSAEEILYSAMEDFELDMIIGKGPSAKSYRIPLPKFTMIGATTRAGSLSAPLRDRFGVMCKFELYSEDALKSIIARTASLLDAPIDDASLLELASRSRGTPRIANRLLKRVRDFAQVKSDGSIGLDIAKSTLDSLGIDGIGLEKVDRDILKLIIEKFLGGPVGIDTISAAIGEERITIEDVYEPYLLQKGLIHRTPKGRIASQDAYIHLGLEDLLRTSRAYGGASSSDLANVKGSGFEINDGELIIDRGTQISIYDEE